MPGSIVGIYAGDAAEFSRSLAGQPWLILAAIVTIYIVLGVLYESYIHPITILSTLPSAGVGAILALLITRNDFNAISLIGVILLIGIVKKNAIMMIDFALEAEREEGKPPIESIYQACLLRFRPIMMTTMAALLGGIPLALGSGTGSELRRPLGITIVGGLIVSQILTLYTTPVVYLFFDRLAQRLRPVREGYPAAPHPAPASTPRRATSRLPSTLPAASSRRTSRIIRPIARSIPPTRRSSSSRSPPIATTPARCTTTPIPSWRRNWRRSKASVR